MKSYLAKIFYIYFYSLLIFLYGDILYMRTGEPDDTKKKARKTTMKRIEIDKEIKAKSIEKATN